MVHGKLVYSPVKVVNLARKLLETERQIWEAKNNLKILEDTRFDVDVLRALKVLGYDPPTKEAIERRKGYVLADIGALEAYLQDLKSLWDADVETYDVDEFLGQALNVAERQYWFSRVIWSSKLLAYNSDYIPDEMLLLGTKLTKTLGGHIFINSLVRITNSLRPESVPATKLLMWGAGEKDSKKFAVGYWDS